MGASRQPWRKQPAGRAGRATPPLCTWENLQNAPWRLGCTGGWGLSGRSTTTTAPSVAANIRSPLSLGRLPAPPGPAPLHNHSISRVVCSGRPVRRGPHCAPISQHDREPHRLSPAPPGPPRTHVERRATPPLWDRLVMSRHYQASRCRNVSHPFLPLSYLRKRGPLSGQGSSINYAPPPRPRLLAESQSVVNESGTVSEGRRQWGVRRASCRRARPAWERLTPLPHRMSRPTCPCPSLNGWQRHTGTGGAAFRHCKDTPSDGDGRVHGLHCAS